MLNQRQGSGDPAKKLKAILPLLLLTTVLGLAACAGSRSGSSPDAAPEATAQTATSAFSLALPQDALKPWETLDASGHVQSPVNSSWLNSGSSGRSASAINIDSEFIPGVQRDSSVGTVTDLGQASSFSSGSAGQGLKSFATYRMTLGGSQPGAASVDVNLKLINGGTQLSSCWVGISDYAKGVWEWHEVTDAQTRFSLARPGANWLSPLGNCYIAVMAYDGAQFDLVGLGANPLDGADTTAPPVPTGLALVPAAGALELQWNPVLAGDLAGYRVYYSKSNFSSGTAPGVKRVPYLEGSTRDLLTGISGNTFVAISAIDISGNESAISARVSAATLAGNAPNLQVLTDVVSGQLGTVATLTASGASSYDIDADGDGLFEITGSGSGTATIDTSKSGIIRPAVRASTGGTAVAYGSVSLIIAANLPPVAVLTATENNVLLYGDGPHNVTLDASGSTDEDVPSLSYAFDPQGDGTFGSPGPTDNRVIGYSTTGSFLSAVRVTDSAGLTGYASVLVSVRIFSGFDTVFATNLSGSSDMISGEMISGAPSIAFHHPPDGQLYYCHANDGNGYNWGSFFSIDLGSNSGQFPSLANIAGKPAVAYYDSNTASLKYIRSTSADGAKQTDWSNPPVVIQNMLTVITNSIVLKEISGQPAILFGNNSDGKLYYVRAVGPSGTGDLAADWTMTPVVADDNGAGGGRPSMAVVGGNPAIAYYRSNDIFYKRALSADGALQTDWSQVPFSIDGPDSTFTDNTSLLVVNGNPAIAFIDTTIPAVRFCRANNTTGATQADWPVPVTVSGLQSPMFTSLSIIDGRPALLSSAFANGLNTMPCFNRALDANGTLWGPWVGGTTQSSFGFLSQKPTLLPCTSGPGICCASGNNVALFLPARSK